MLNRKGFEFSFGWMFAIVVGAVILFLAIYAASRFVGTERTVQDTQVARQVDILLNPLSTGLEEGKTAEIKFNSNTRIYNDCTLNGNFGEQKISAATSSSIGGTWQDAGVSAKSYGKYVFSSGIIEGKEMIVFSKPFEMPYKAGDLIFAWSGNEMYCFVNSPNDIKNELEDLKPKNIELKISKELCSAGSRKVCFAESGCDIDVNINSKKVSRNGKREGVYYEGELVYGAIFSEPALYECQVRRLMKRVSILAEIYGAKSGMLTAKGCSSNLEGSLNEFIGKTAGVTGSQQLSGVENMAEEIRRKNGELLCRLF